MNIEILRGISKSRPEYRNLARNLIKNLQISSKQSKSRQQYRNLIKNTETSPITYPKTSINLTKKEVAPSPRLPSPSEKAQKKKRKSSVRITHNRSIINSKNMNSTVNICSFLLNRLPSISDCEGEAELEVVLDNGLSTYKSEVLEFSLMEECCQGTPLELRITSLSAAILLILAYAVLLVFIHKYRKCKALSLWRLHVLIVGGSCLLAASPACKIYSCTCGVWLRELGYICCYGGVLLVHYKSLVEWRTRKAHRWIVREKDLLRYLALMLLITTAYITSHSDSLCTKPYFTIVTLVSELLMTTVALYECWVIRSGGLDKNYLLLLVTDLLAGTVWIVSFWVGSGLFWIELGRVTIGGICLLLIYGCKLNSAKSELKTRPGTVQQRKIYINNELIENINLDEMEAGEIRSELKRVYTQLELLRSKTMRLDNPHISRRRGGRKLTASGQGGGGIGRRFSLQRKSGAAKKKRQPPPPEITDYIEDSICSREAD